MSWIDNDSLHVWHPFTQAKTDKRFLPIVKAKDAVLFDSEGKQYIDAISSWWVAALGHANAEISAAISEQALDLHQVIFATCTHPVAVDLATELNAITPSNLTRSFFTDNGSCAVEAALKMCVQFYDNKGINRKKFIALNNGYHGDTFGAMSVGGANVFNSAYSGLLFDTYFIDPPFPGSEKESLDQLIKVVETNDDIAGFIYEPLLQGAGGMLMHSASGLDELLKVCKEHGIFCIADEIFTGFFRTGAMFASDRLANKPDIMCLSKALTGGTLPLGVTIASEEIFEGFWSDERKKLFWHGHSFTANALACVAALKSIEIYRKGTYNPGIEMIQASHESFAEELRSNNLVENVRQIGIVLAFDVKSEQETSYINNIRNLLYNYYLDNGVVIRPLGNTVYMVPPYCISKKQLQKVYDVVLSSLDYLKSIGR